MIGAAPVEGRTWDVMAFSLHETMSESWHEALDGKGVSYARSMKQVDGSEDETARAVEEHQMPCRPRRDRLLVHPADKQGNTLNK